MKTSDLRFGNRIQGWESRDPVKGALLRAHRSHQDWTTLVPLISFQYFTLLF